jgi:glycosyltransferase involved in cell wall biosynthesis
VLDVVHINTTYARSVADFGWPAPRKLLALTRYLKALVVTCRRRGVRYVIITPAFSLWPFVKDSLGVLAAAFLTGARIVLWCNNNDLPWLLEGVPRLVRSYIAFILRKATHVVAVGETLKEPFVRLVGTSRVTVIPNAVPSGPAAARASTGRGGVRILYLSNMMKAKGWMTLLRVGERVCSTRPDVTFAFCGSASADSSFEEIARAFFSCAFPARIVYREVKAAELAAADVFCLPSAYVTEAMPVAVLEAMCQGLPVVGTDAGAISEAIVDGQGGLIVPQGDVDRLEKAILRLVDDPSLRQRMGRFNRARFEAEYTLDQVAERWIGLFERLEQEGLRQTRP